MNPFQAPNSEISSLDLDRLNSQEKTLLQDRLNGGSDVWKAAALCVAWSILGVVVGMRHGVALADWLQTGVPLKVAGFIILGFLAYRWSLLAAIGLLGWHLYFNSGYLGGNLFPMKAFYFGMAIWFIFSIISSNMRRTLLKKARQ